MPWYQNPSILVPSVEFFGFALFFALTLRLGVYDGLYETFFGADKNKKSK